MINPEDIIIQCPNCRGNDIEGKDSKLGSYHCKECGFKGVYLNFVFWSKKFVGDRNYLIVN